MDQRENAVFSVFKTVKQVDKKRRHQNLSAAGARSQNSRYRRVRIYNTANAIGYTLTKGGGTVENNPAGTLFNG